jgi:glucose-6-phosphate isomerase
MSALTEKPAWKALQAHAQTMAGRHLRDLFRGQPDRFQHYHFTLDDILAEVSKQRIDEETCGLLNGIGRPQV